MKKGQMTEVVILLAILIFIILLYLVVKNVVLK